MSDKDPRQPIRREIERTRVAGTVMRVTVTDHFEYDEARFWLCGCGSLHVLNEDSCPYRLEPWHYPDVVRDIER